MAGGLGAVGFEHLEIYAKNPLKEAAVALSLGKECPRCVATQRRGDFVAREQEPTVARHDCATSGQGRAGGRPIGADEV